MKHSPETNLEDLDFKAIDKEIEVDEVVQATQVVAFAGEDLPVPEKGGTYAPEA